MVIEGGGFSIRDKLLRIVEEGSEVKSRKNGNGKAKKDRRTDKSRCL